MTWTTAGELVTATKLNEVFPHGDDAWIAWSPTYGNLTVGNGTVVSRYIQIGQLVALEYSITFGSTSAIAGNVTITLPVAGSLTANAAIGQAIFNDASGGRATGIIRSDGTNAVPHPLRADATYLTTNNLSSTVPFTWATGDILSFSAAYEAA